VRPRDDLDLGRERPDVGQAAAVDADLVAQDPLADQLLVQRAERRADLLLAALELRPDLLQHRGLELVQPRLAVLLAGDRQRLGQIVGGGRGDRLEHVVLEGRERREAAGGLGGQVGELLLGHAQGADERLGRLQPGRDDLLGGRLRAGRDELDRSRWWPRPPPS
jgi:hypothetical protein